MCGILGEVAFSGSLSSSKTFSNLLNLSHSRGPDSTQIEVVRNRVQFGFNRLAIIDPSENSNQPIWSNSKRYLIMYNGEIYNHINLRKKLSNQGKMIKGYGDTSTLAQCIDEWGIEKTISQLDGMFSICVWDNYQKTISLIRDFAGIKPLFYGYNGKFLVFASQYNQISRHPYFVHNNINKEVLKLFFLQHYISSPFGLLNNTFSLKPGEIITFNKNGDRFSKFFWEFPDYEEVHTSKSFNINYLDNEINSAVKSELISDVPLGAFLSGGVDSPLICYYASKEKNENFNTFCIGSDSKKHDETVLSKQYADSINTEHHIKKMNSSNSLSELEKAVASTGEPFGDFSLLPMWEVSKMASRSVRVALSGDGGDELFFGYERFQSIGKNFNLWSAPYVVRYFLRGLDKLIFNEKHLNECILSRSPGDSHFGLHNHSPYGILEKIAPSVMKNKLPIDYDVFNYSLPKTRNELLFLIRKAEFYGMLQKTLLKVDRISMAHSLEVRVPFLKKSLIENVIKMGITIHSPIQNRKKLLQQLLQRHYPKIRHEKNKKGFLIPLTKWIKEGYKDIFYDALLDRNFCDSFGLSRRMIEKNLDLHVKGIIDLKWTLFSLYSLSVWNTNQTILIERN